ncbi:MAG: hypothetical protein IPK82_05990 [Polyangiaceae bacterium]|nr:hypothetical protein [Polyangiaceae bacterium]
MAIPVTLFVRLSERACLVFDGAGVTETASFDFKGKTSSTSTTRLGISPPSGMTPNKKSFLRVNKSPPIKNLSTMPFTG